MASQLPSLKQITVSLGRINPPRTYVIFKGPGSSLFFFEGPQTVNAGDSTYKSSHVGSTRMFRYLHCGDFRASPRHTLHPAVKDKRIDIIYLDTTYLNPRVSRNEGIWRLLLIERYEIVFVSCPGPGHFGMRRARQTLGFGSRDRGGRRRQGLRE